MGPQAMRGGDVQSGAARCNGLGGPTAARGLQLAAVLAAVPNGRALPPWPPAPAAANLPVVTPWLCRPHSPLPG